MIILYVDKSVLRPGQFGVCSSNPDKIMIRKDLPLSIRNFLLSHELYHSTDQRIGWIMREVRANFHAAIREPLGFILTMIYSLSINRIKYYVQRYKDGY